MEENEKKDEVITSQDKSTRSHPNLQEMILEYAWTHNMKDLHAGVDTSLWMEAKQQYTLREPWRLRVASAQACSIMKNRDVGGYERVLSLLDATYRLVPTLVVAIKHMKIMFGLKTLVTMWMFQQCQSIVPIVIKILQFFPSKLPQYQDRCSNREMFLMRKNHLDFKLFAQSLAMDKRKLDKYIQNHLEEQYGEHYAQKLEDRLLHYLHKLEMMLPRDTYIDQLLQNECPVRYEDKLLLEVMAEGSTTIATSLKRLLQQGDKGCRPVEVSSKSVVATADVELVRLTEAAVNNVSSAPPGSEMAPEVLLEDRTQAPKAVCRHLYQDSPLLLVSQQQQQEEEEVCSGGGGEVGRPKGKEGLSMEAVEAMKTGDCSNKTTAKHAEQEEGDSGQREEDSGEEGQLSQKSSDSQRVASSSSILHLQFCSKHQRWVRSILAECSEELETQGEVPSDSSPLLLPSSSSSSSQDLTPSGLVPCDDLFQKPAATQTSSLDQATSQGPGLAPPMLNRVSGPAEKHVANSTSRPLSVHSVCSSEDFSLANTAPNPSHYMAPSNLPCTTALEPLPPQYCPTESSETLTFSPPKPEAPSSIEATAGFLSDGAPPQWAPVVDVSRSEQHQQALASTPVPAHRQQTLVVRVSCSSPPSAHCPPPTARQPLSRLSRKFRRAARKTEILAPAQSSCVTVPERRCHLSRSSEQTPALLRHPDPAVSSEGPSEAPALPLSGNLHTGSLSSTRTARVAQYTGQASAASASVLSPVVVISRCPLPSSLRSTLAGQPVYAVTNGPPLSHAAQDLHHAPSQLPRQQPYVRLTRLQPRVLQYCRETETQLGETVADEDSGGEGDQEVFDPNILFSSDDSSGRDSEDPDYIPYKPRTLKLLLTSIVK